MQKIFKGGFNFNASNPLCKDRYQQVSITALGNLTQSSSRLLQSNGGSTTPTTYSMSLTVGTVGSTSTSSALIKMISYTTVGLLGLISLII
jgi:hypothetical protein